MKSTVLISQLFPNPEDTSQQIGHLSWGPIRLPLGACRKEGGSVLGWQWKVEGLRGGGTVWNIFIFQSERSKEEKRALRQLLTLHSELLCAELLLSIVITYLYKAAKRRDPFHIHLH